MTKSEIEVRLSRRSVQMTKYLTTFVVVLCVAGPALGGTPNSRLNARVKAASE